MRATTGRPFFIVSSAITGRDAATTVLAGASVRLQKEVLVDYRLERLLHGGVEAELTQLAHALDGRAAGGAHRVHACDWVLGAVHSKRAAAHNRRGGDLLCDRSCKSRADTRLRQSVNVHQNKRARCPAESSECRKQVFIYMVHLADRREYRVGGFYMCARCRLAAAYRRYGGFDFGVMLGIIRHNYFSVNIVLEIAGFRFYTCTVENEDGQRLEQRIISHRRLNGCIGDFLYLKSLNNE